MEQIEIFETKEVNEFYTNTEIFSSLKYCLNFCLEQSSNVINAIKEKSPITKDQLSFLSFLYLFMSTQAQSDPALTQCLSMLATTSEQLSQCLNNTAILNKIVNITTPDTRIDNYSGYIHTIFGAWISVAGCIIFTPLCDSLTCLVSYIFETRNKARLDKLQKSIDDLTNSTTFSDEQFNTLRDFLCVVVGRLDNNINEEQARRKIDQLLHGENKIAEVIALLPEVLNLNSTDTSGQFQDAKELMEMMADAKKEGL